MIACSALLPFVAIGSSSASEGPAPEQFQVPELAPLESGIETTSAGFSAEADSGSVSVPLALGTPVSVDFEGTEIELPLPEIASTASGRLVAEAITYPGDDVEVQVLPGAEQVRVQTIIPSHSSPTEYVYEFGEGATPVLDPSGVAAVFPEAEDGPVVTLDVPWAVDANGVEVDTHYEVRGTALVQVVDHSAQTDLTYPITADPTYSWGWGAYVHCNRAETKTIAASGFGAAVLGGACAALGGLVARAAGAAVGGAACAVAATTVIYQAGIAENSSPKKCLLIRGVGAPIVGAIFYPATYSDNRCK